MIVEKVMKNLCKKLNEVAGNPAAYRIGEESGGLHIITAGNELNLRHAPKFDSGGYNIIGYKLCLEPDQTVLHHKNIRRRYLKDIDKVDPEKVHEICQEMIAAVIAERQQRDASIATIREHTDHARKALRDAFGDFNIKEDAPSVLIINDILCVRYDKDNAGVPEFRIAGIDVQLDKETVRVIVKILQTKGEGQ